MDVVIISSDSETSFNDSNIDKNSTLPFSIGEETEVFKVDWNDGDDARPPIEYSFELTEMKGELSYEIENYKTPVKLSQTNVLEHVIDEDDCIVLESCATNNLRVPKSDSLTSASDSENCSPYNNLTVKSPEHKVRQRHKLSQEEKTLAKLAKEQKILERGQLKEKKRAEQQKQKALKAALFENQRNLRPEENIKFLKVHIDNDIINSVFGGNVISVLQQNNIQYVVESQKKSCTVTWSKKRIEKVLDDFGEITEKVEVKDECVLLYVLNWEQAVNLIHRNDLLSHIETVKSAFINKKLTLVIYGLGKYFTYKKKKRNADFRAEVNDKKKARPNASEREFANAHNISGDQLEFALSELQLIGKHNCRLLETPEEFSALIHNFTKSLSQIDFKLERQKRQNNDVGWVAIDSSSQSVKVDKNGNGLLHLWQRQICQFSSVGLETAQAIIAHYNSPMALMSDYSKCGSEKDGQLLLQNIQIRRDAGIVSSSRRVGPQLSKKIYKFFTSDDPDMEL